MYKVGAKDVLKPSFFLSFVSQRMRYLTCKLMRLNYLLDIHE
ncbi:hypothetical protein BH09BAC4_BH09BAC4_01830 [soil metagenome]|uniref:Uncharacterized protein n=1 Tax=Spirosoma endophyticum TaxID=662367 RepID=A0A1I2ARL8_9BACT|nr:hypothetical protein SAMN05216167_11466 [Spirosoma endophyticum]